LLYKKYIRIHLSNVQYSLSKIINHTDDSRIVENLEGLLNDKISIYDKSEFLEDTILLFQHYNDRKEVY